MMTKFSWDNLQTFVTVSELASFSAGARELGVSKQTVSRRISELEDELGQDLLVRSTAGFELTDAGQRVRKIGLSMLDRASALFEALPRDAEEPAGLVRISGYPSFVYFHLASRVRQLTDKYPDIMLQVTTSSVIDEPRPGELEIVIGYERAVGAGLISERIGTTHFMLYASQDYIDEFGAPTSHTDLVNHRRGLNEYFLVYYPEKEAQTIGFAKALDWHLNTNSTEWLAQACASGGGVCTLPSTAMYVDKRLVPIALPAVAQVPVYAVYPERATKVKRVNLALDWIRASVRGEVAIHFEEILDLRALLREGERFRESG